MKKKGILMASMYALFIMSSQSCSNDDDTGIDRCDNCKPQRQTKKGQEKEKVKGSVSIVFDNYLGDKKMKMNDNSFDYKCSSAEGQAALKKITAFDYIVSNFILKNETGDSIVYPKEKSYFIISEEGQEYEVPHYKYGQRPTPKELDEPGEKNTMVNLDSIVAGKYTSMSFILGVDTDCGDWGTDGPDWAEEFFKKCATYGLDWFWMVTKKNRVFKNVRFEGEFLNQGDTENTEFAIHIIDYMNRAREIQKVAYRKIIIKFPKDKPLIVDEGSKGKINLHMDAGKLFNGSKKTNKIASSIMGGKLSIDFADNFQEMFTVESVESE